MLPTTVLSACAPPVAIPVGLTSVDFRELIEKVETSSDEVTDELRAPSSETVLVMFSSICREVEISKAGVI